jgi:formylglycine-generating enzyme
VRAIFLGALAIGGCRAFVDLDGLRGGAAPDDAASDVIATGDAADAPTDGGGIVDVIPPLDVVDQDGDAAKPCPTKGGAAVRVPVAGGGSFCIDTTEVTRAEYATFLATSPDGGSQPARCTWNTSFVPTSWPPAQADLQKPANVDWCDAHAFCTWAGKRLCGKVGGGVLSFAAAGTIQSEQAYVCSAGGTRVYPYGDVYDANKCNGGESNSGGLENVKSRPGCEGGFAGVFDSNGNTHQWLDACVIGADPATDQCAVSGGAYDGHPEADMACTKVEGAIRSTIGSPNGFRCCAD